MTKQNCKLETGQFKRPAINNKIELHYLRSMVRVAYEGGKILCRFSSTIVNHRRFETKYMQDTMAC
jgi:hypothetical protein